MDMVWKLEERHDAPKEAELALGLAWSAQDAPLAVGTSLLVFWRRLDRGDSALGLWQTDCGGGAVKVDQHKGRTVACAWGRATRPTRRPVAAHNPSAYDEK